MSASAIYEGGVRHRRLDAGRARVSLPPRDGSTSISTSCPRRSTAIRCRSARRRGARVRSGGPTTSATRATPLADCVRDSWRSAPASRPAGPVRLLTTPADLRPRLQPRSASTTASTPTASTSRPWSPRSPTRPGASVTPTCWGAATAQRGGAAATARARTFHVSPFIGDGADATSWRMTRARRAARACTIERARRDGERVFEALARRSAARAHSRAPADAGAARASRRPSVRVVALIYWNALQAEAQGRAVPTTPATAERRQEAMR